MLQQLKFIGSTIAALVVLVFGLFAINQLLQWFNFAYAVHPVFGWVSTVVIAILMLGLALSPVWLFFKLPQALTLPKTAAEKPAFLDKLGKQLAENKHLKDSGLAFGTEEEIRKGITLLDEKADIAVNMAAKGVFLTTAISQNGKLDALVVFTSQCKMVWEVAHIYYARPTPKDMLNLYANVGAATFFASQIEDIDISEQMEPVISNVIQSTALQNVPFVGKVSALVTDSILEGTINSYLTLRVGVIAKQYCGAMEAFSPRVARKAAYREAAVMLRKLVMQSSGQVIEAIVKGAKKAGVDTVKAGADAVTNATKPWLSSLFFWNNPSVEPVETKILGLNNPSE